MRRQTGTHVGGLKAQNEHMENISESKNDLPMDWSLTHNIPKYLEWNLA